MRISVPRSTHFESPSSANRINGEFSIFSPRPEDSSSCSPESQQMINFNDCLSLDSLCSPRDNVDGRMDIRKPTTSTKVKPPPRSLGHSSLIPSNPLKFSTITNKHDSKKSSPLAMLSDNTKSSTISSVLPAM